MLPAIKGELDEDMMERMIEVTPYWHYLSKRLQQSTTAMPTKFHDLTPADLKHSKMRSDDSLHKGKDLRIPNTTPEHLAKALMSGGEKPRAETKKQKAS